MGKKQIVPFFGECPVFPGAVIKLFYIAILIYSFVLSPAFAGEDKRRVKVCPVKSGEITIKPGNPLTVVFRVTNIDHQRHEFSEKVELPEEWKVITREFPFKLAAGEDTIRLVSLFVPFKAKAVQYQIAYMVRAKDDSSISSQCAVKVNVLLHTEIKIQLLERPEIVIAGEDYQCCFLVSNKSNSASDIKLDIKSREGFAASCDESDLRLDAGDCKSVTVNIKTDSGIRKNLKHCFQVTAIAVDLEDGKIRATARSAVDVIPRISGEEDYYHRLPMQIKFIGIANKGSGNQAQIALSGSGTIYDKGSQKIDFLFRGPKSENQTIFYPLQEEYRLRFSTERAEIYLGDHIFFLSKLTEYGHYGRGFEGKLNMDSLSLKAYYRENLWVVPKRKQKALQLGYRIGKNSEFKFNYLENKETHQPEGFSKNLADDQIYSFQSLFSIWEIINLDFEYAWGKKNSGQVSKTGGAFWLEALGRYKKINFRLNTIRSGKDFPGYYRDMTFNSASISFPILNNFRFNAEYHGQKANLTLDPNFPAYDEIHSRLSLRCRFGKRTNLSLEYINRERSDLSTDPDFNYNDKSLRVGTRHSFGRLSFYASVDMGKTQNKLTNQTSKLVEYMGSASFRLNNKLSFSGYFQLRDQDKNFTGEQLQRLTMNFNMRLNLGRTSFYALYRTAFHREFYDKILMDVSRIDSFFIHKLNLLDISLKHHFTNGHSIAFRVRKYSYGETRPNNVIGLLEYTIPLRLPVSRKTNIGTLKGRVYDSENNAQGIAGVIVRANELTNVTDKNGNFTFYSLNPGTYYLDVDRGTIGLNRVTVQKIPMKKTVEGSRKIEVNIGVVRSASISGKIMVYRFEKDGFSQYIRSTIDNKHKRKLIESYGLGNTLVELKSESEICRRITDNKGRFSFNELRPGTWTLKIYDNNVPKFHYLEKDTFDFELVANGKDKVLARVLPRIRQIQIIEGGEITLEKKKEDSKLKTP